MNCEICGSDKFVDAHHYDCKEGKLSPETINLCRRCHRTYHDRGIEWFDDDLIDKAIEVENKRREIRNAHLEELNQERLNESIKLPYYSWLKKPILHKSPLKREDIQRSVYWNKIHGIKKRKQPTRETVEQKRLGFEVIENLMKL